MLTVAQDMCPACQLSPRNCAASAHSCTPALQQVTALSAAAASLHRPLFPQHCPRCRGSLLGLWPLFSLSPLLGTVQLLCQ